jgi:hypothetical protein
MSENQETTEQRLERARREYLTPELRGHFEHMGIAAVEFDVFNHRYTGEAKHFAALAWLAEKREEKERRESWRFRLILVIASATLIVAALTYFRG